jgi:hypothetical protein
LRLQEIDLGLIGKAKIAFMRLAASSSKKPWLPRRPLALKAWGKIERALQQWMKEQDG